MNASYVEQHQIIDRYLLGKLSEQQAEEFEILCLHDQRVLDQLELSEKMLAGFQRADERNMLHEIQPQPAAENSDRPRAQQSAGSDSEARARVFPPWNYATAASVFLGVCLVSSITVFSQRDVPSGAYEPQINTPVIPFAITRSASGVPDHVVHISDRPQWMVLEMDLSKYEQQYESYRATLLDQDNTVVWQSDGLELNFRNYLTLSLNSAGLAEGNYVVRIEGLADSGSPVRVVDYSFKAKLREEQ